MPALKLDEVVVVRRGKKKSVHDVVDRSPHDDDVSTCTVTALCSSRPFSIMWRRQKEQRVYFTTIEFVEHATNAGRRH